MYDLKTYIKCDHVSPTTDGTSVAVLSLRGGSFIAKSSSLSYIFADFDGNPSGIRSYGYAKYVPGTYDSAKAMKWIGIVPSKN